MSELRWLYLSGAPPLVIPRSLAPLWRGITDRSTGKYRELERDHHVTDY